MSKHIYILGIAGTFMGGVALLAKQMGFEVSGCDQNVYPPMSDALMQAGIQFSEGYAADSIPDSVDCVVIGNALSRGNPVVESVLRKKLPYTSGPQWLAENILQHKHVLAVAGTHGKTTTSSLLLWILQTAGLKPGYLIGGMPNNFNQTAFLSDSKYFVIEADEYDTAFFDKRSKFIHYHPQTLVLNNLEYDHADIFPDLNAIKTQFQFLLRTVPDDGAIVVNQKDPNLQEVLERGCWTPVIGFAGDNDWQARGINDDGTGFDVYFKGEKLGRIEWSLLGMHNVHNALAAMAAAHQVGVSFEASAAALASFQGIKRRLELISDCNGIKIYDDFAHHPTAIKTTLEGLRARVKDAGIIVLLQLGSNSMKAGVHLKALPDALSCADQVILWKPEDADWGADYLQDQLGKRLIVQATTDEIIQHVRSTSRAGDHIVIMSNKSFEGIHQALAVNALQLRPL